MGVKTLTFSTTFITFIMVTIYLPHLKVSSEGVRYNHRRESDEDASGIESESEKQTIFNHLNPLVALNGFRKNSPYSLQITEILQTFQPDFVRIAGYPVEVHEIHTRDGYILTVHRIPYGRKSNESRFNEQRQPILIQHGFLATSSDWIMQPRDKALPYILADTGLYDVWLGNIRGNKYAQRHETLRTDEDSFWNYSYHESAIFDVTAMINYILNYSGKERLSFVGHSMGNNIIYAALALFPEYNSKIKIVFSLAPAPFLGHMKSPVSLLSPFSSIETNSIEIFGPREVDFSKILQLLQGSSDLSCLTSSFASGSCIELSTLVGLDLKAINETWLPVILSQYPDVSSSKTLVHFLQEISTGNFALFDYGSMANFKRYGQTVPPNYDLSLVKVPVVVVWANDDVFVDPEDIQKLLTKLPYVPFNIKVTTKYFNHNGFLYSPEAASQVYAKILRILSELP